MRKAVESAPSADGKQRMSVFLLVHGIANFARLFTQRSRLIEYPLLWFVVAQCNYEAARLSCPTTLKPNWVLIGTKLRETENCDVGF